MTAPLGGSGSAQMADLARKLYRMGPAGRRNLRRKLGELGSPVLAAAQARASWSTRIPGALSVRPVTTDARVGIALRVRSGGDTPHARPFEGITGEGAFRHPVFGRPPPWVQQSTRPYALPAVQANEGAAAAASAAAFEDAAREAGFT